MKLDEAKLRFIEAWGTLGSNWGINRTMAQVHALLLISPESLSTDDVMEKLNISRGNANMNLRDLIDWGLVKKQLKPGERKEFFLAEKHIWTVFIRIARERKRRELEPIFNVLEDLQTVEGDDKDTKSFIKMIGDIQNFSKRADKTLDTMIKADENKFMSAVIKLLT